MSEYRVEELARLAGTTVRNLRAYQDRGLLPPPRRSGRVALYADGHLERLRLIADLLDRGYSLAGIGDLLAGFADGRGLGDLLGLEAAITTPFSDEVPLYTTLEAVLEELGPGGDDDTELARQILELGLVEIDGDRLRVPSPRTMRAGIELVKAGIPRAEVLAQARAIRDDMERVASRLVDLVVTQIFDRYDHGVPPPEEAGAVADLVRRLRPLAQMVVDAELARGLEKHARARLGERLEALLALRDEEASA